jgi:hypothetical protein
MHNLDLKEIPWIYKEDLLVGRIKWERGEKGEGGRGLNMVKVTYAYIRIEKWKPLKIVNKGGIRN